MALAHAVGNKAERAYRRGRALAKRRAFMDAWQAHCCGASSKDAAAQSEVPAPVPMGARSA